MEFLASLPQCGVTCIVSSLSTATCDVSNTTCLCLDMGYQKVVTSCVVESCGVRDLLAVRNGTRSACGAHEPNEDTSLTAISLALISLQTIFFVLRMLCRAVRIAPWGWDDTTIVVAFVLTTSFGGAAVLESRYGLGRNIWTVDPDNIDPFLMVFFAFETIYVFALAFIKISICFLYLRIFPGHRFRIAVWATQVFNVALAIAFSITDMFQCRPIKFFWMGWDGEHEGSCFNLEAFLYSHAGVNILLDIWMLALPASQIWRLNLAPQKKVGVYVIFGFGILLTLVSIIRLEGLKGFSKKHNPTVDFYRVAIWTAIEITAGLMVACMPAARLFVMYFISRFLCGKRSHLNERYRARTVNSDSNSNDNGDGSPAVARTLSKRSKKFPLDSILSSKDLDKNRQYSMSVTVTSAKNFLPPECDALQLAEQGSLGVDFSDQSGSAKSSPTGEKFGLSEKSLVPGDNNREKPTRILVTQNVSVSSTSSPQSHNLQKETPDSNKGA